MPLPFSRMLPAVAIQIVNFKTAAYLERCLAAVVDDARSSGLDYTVHVLDNASGDDVESIAGRFPGCHAHVSERNLGFGGGQNRLAGLNGAPYLLFFNPDTEVTQPRTVERLLRSLLDHPQAAIAGPKLVGSDGEPQRWDHGRLHGLRAQTSLRGGHSYWRPTGVAQDVAWVSGAAMLVERGAFERVGGFDERFFLYKEDEDLCHRVRQAGRRIRYEPGVTIRHHGSVVAGRGAELALAERQFIEKHFAQHRRRQRIFAWIHRALPYVRL